jgi:DNA polymerase III delta prime subunit
MKNINRDFRFLSEKPLEVSEEKPLAFGHKDIVNTLSKIVKNSPESFTIGLYGDWGSGKSTIAGDLKKELGKENVPVAIFDVWKHEGDSLRRTFLTFLAKNLSEDYPDEVFSNKFEIDERTYNAKTINTEIAALKKGSKLYVGIAGFFFSIFFGFIFLILHIVFDFTNAVEGTLAAIIATVSIIPIQLVFKIANQLIDNKKVTTVADRFKDPHEFEEEFKRILDKGLKAKKLVIVFDNLDRVNGDKALEIMSTIKTFLDPIDKELKDKKDVLFIIPCDEKAIKRHIKKALSYEDDGEYERYASEYLRKFFNTIIWIPEFYSSELENLASANLKATNIPELNNFDVAALIVLVFDKNPRQIIQYVNILVANYLLLKERKIDGFDLDGNIPQLAKYLLLLQRFPDMVDLLRQGRIYDLNDPNAFVGISVESVPAFQEFRHFISITDHIPIASLDVFFKLRRSEFESQLENSERLLKLIQTQETRNIYEYREAENSPQLNLKKLNDPTDIQYLDKLNLLGNSDVFNQVIKQKITQLTNPVLVNKFVDGVFYLIKYYGLELNANTYATLVPKLERSISHLDIINPANLIVFGINKIPQQALSKKLTPTLKKQWIADFLSRYPEAILTNSTVVRDGYGYNILMVFVEYHELFNKDELSPIRQALSSYFSYDLDVFGKISGDRNLRVKLSSPEYLANVISVANEMHEGGKQERIDTSEGHNRVIQVCQGLIQYDSSILTVSVTKEILNFLIFNLEGIADYSPYQTANINALIEPIFPLFLKAIEVKKGNDELRLDLMNTIISNFTCDNYRYANDFFRLLYAYKSIADPDAVLQANTVISDYIAYEHSGNIKQTVESTIDLNEFFLDKILTDVIKLRVLVEASFLNTFYIYFDENDQYLILTTWLSADSESILELLKTIDFKVTKGDELGFQILQLASSQSSWAEKKTLYSILMRLPLSDTFDYSRYSEQVIELIVSANKQYQELGLQQLMQYEKYINEYKLQSASENKLRDIYFSNLPAYSQNIENILKSNFGGNKKLINDLTAIEDIKENIVAFVLANDDVKFFNTIKSYLYKRNIIDLSKLFLIRAAERVRNDKNFITTYHEVLESISKKYMEDYKMEMAYFIENHKLGLQVEPHDFIKQIESLIS